MTESDVTFSLFGLKPQERRYVTFWGKAGEELVLIWRYGASPQSGLHIGASRQMDCKAQ